MSLRRWNTVLERKHATNFALYSAFLLRELDKSDDNSLSESSLASDGRSMGDISSDLSTSSSDYSSWSNMDFDCDSLDGSMSVSDDDSYSESSISSESSTGTSTFVEKIHREAVLNVANIYGAVESPDVQWGKRVMIEDISESDAIEYFRFRKRNLFTIADRLWPRLEHFLEGEKDNIKVENSYQVPFETGLLMVLFRLARPVRLRPEMEIYFGIRRSRISAALRTFFFALWAMAIPYFNNPEIFRNRMPYYAERISWKCGHLVQNLWGFIDGTLRPTCRPSYFQKLTYSGHKRSHGIKFQSVITPDGLIANLFGPMNGNRHDSFLLLISGLLPKLEQMMPEGGPSYALYGDPAYPQSRALFGGFRHAAPGSVEAAWNHAMSAVRQPVEWCFGDILRYFRFLDFTASMKIFESPVAVYYIVAAFLTNIRCCLQGNQTCVYFDAQTMTLDEYLSLVDSIIE